MPQLFENIKYCEHAAMQAQNTARKTLVAEKLEALVKLASSNTRLKDYFDLWLLSTAEQIDHAALPKAIAATFERRKRSCQIRFQSGSPKATRPQIPGNGMHF